MDSSKNGRWIIPFKNFCRLSVKIKKKQRWLTLKVQSHTDVEFISAMPVTKRTSNLQIMNECWLFAVAF